MLGGLAGTPIAVLLFEEFSVEDDGLTCCDDLVLGFDFSGEVCVILDLPDDIGNISGHVVPCHPHSCTAGLGVVGSVASIFFIQTVKE